MVQRSTTKSSQLRRGALSCTASLVLAACAAAPAAAAPAPEPVAFALSADSRTGSFLLQGTPGRTVRGAVLVRNVSRRRVTVRLYRADIRNAGNGNADYVTKPRSGAGRWLRLSRKKVELAARSTRRVPFAVHVPASAVRASHYAGVVAVDVADLKRARSGRQAKKRGFSFQRVNRQALPVTIRLPGRLTRRLSLRTLTVDSQPAGAALLLALKTGGSELIQSSRVQLRVLRGERTVLHYSSTLGQLFPGRPLDHRIPWRGRLARGDYRVVGVIRPHRAPAIHIDEVVHVTGAAAKVPAAPKTLSPELSPTLPTWVWFALASGGLALLLLVLTVWKLRRRAGEVPA